MSTRTHKYHSCGTVMHRDHNTAKQILAKGLKNTVVSTEIKAFGQKDLYLAEEPPLDKLSGSKKNPTPLVGVGASNQQGSNAQLTITIKS
ncbi:MAG: hypothetical protein ACSI46_09795 [Gloeotrichia echinulata DVL01]